MVVFGIYVPQPTPSPSPDQYAPPIYLDPSTSFLASMLISFAVVLVLAFIVEGAREQRRNSRLPCICGHSREEHAGHLAWECLKCKCRQYIADWRRQ